MIGGFLHATEGVFTLLWCCTVLHDSYRRVRMAHQSHHQGPWTAWLLKTESIGHPPVWVTIKQHSLMAWKSEDPSDTHITKLNCPDCSYKKIVKSCSYSYLFVHPYNIGKSIMCVCVCVFYVSSCLYLHWAINICLVLTLVSSTSLLNFVLDIFVIVSFVS